MIPDSYSVMDLGNNPGNYPLIPTALQVRPDTSLRGARQGYVAIFNTRRSIHILLRTAKNPCQIY